MTVLDWDHNTQTISRSRHIECQVPALFDEAGLNRMLDHYPNAQLVRVASHDGLPQDKVRHPDGTQYLDEFGLPVYLSTMIDWHGELTDIDTRYEGTHLITNHQYDL